MRRFIKTNLLLIYFVLSLFYMETIFRIVTLEVLLTIEYVRSLFFLLTFAIGFYLVCSLCKGTATLFVASLLLGCSAMVYTSQIIYYKFFKTFYFIYSLGNATQVIDFRKDILYFLSTHAILILLLLLPNVFLLVIGRKRIIFEKSSWVNRLVLVCCMIFSQLVGMVTIYAGGHGQHSAYDLYYKNSYPLLSVQRLGLFTSMRIDLQRLLVGWSPSIEAPISAEPVFTHVRSREPIGKEPIENNAPIPIEYNIQKIDFGKLIAEEPDKEVKNMHNYFANVTPSTKNDFTGKYKGYNVILITAEGFSPYAVQKDVTPTLYKLANEGYKFENFYTPLWGVSTSDGEYVALNSLLPKNGVWSFKDSGNNKLPYVLGNQLKNQGYKTLAYHNHTFTYYGRDISHPNMGYIYKGIGNGLNVKKTWPESDLEMIEQSVPEYIHSEPFHTYYMTVSGHMQYSFTGNYIALKNKKEVENLSYSEQAKAYLATQIELDRALKNLMNELEKAGIAERTLIALSADHYPYGLEKQTIDELVGHPVEENFELYKSTFILYTKGMEPMNVTKPASSLDILPTLSNLLGLDFDSRLLMGRDIFSNAAPLVTFANKSFITDKGRYNAITQEFTSNSGEEVDEAYINSISSLVQEKFYYSAKILETDYYSKLSGNEK